MCNVNVFYYSTHIIPYAVFAKQMKHTQYLTKIMSFNLKYNNVRDAFSFVYIVFNYLFIYTILIG